MKHLDEQLLGVMKQLSVRNYRAYPKLVTQAIDLIEQGASVNILMERKSLLLWASGGRSPELVEVLFQHGIQPNREGEQVLACALNSLAHFAGKIEDLQCLIDSPKTENTYPLQGKLKQTVREFGSKMDVVQLLIENKSLVFPPLDAFVLLLKPVQHPGAKDHVHPALLALFDAGFDPKNAVGQAGQALGLHEKIRSYLKDEYEAWGARVQAQLIAQGAGVDLSVGVRGVPKM